MKSIIEFLNGLDTTLDLVQVYENGMSFEEFGERVHTYISEQDIVYYIEAMKYLREHDASLRYSLEIANDMGVSLIDCNSELLATLLYQNNLSEEFSEISGEIEEFFESIEE